MRSGACQLFSVGRQQEWILTCVKYWFEGLNVSGHPWDPVDSHFIDPPLLHFLNALADNVRHLGALAPANTTSSCIHFPTTQVCDLVFNVLWPLCSQRMAAETVHALCHHINFDSKHSALLFGWRPLQAEVPAGKLHGELHFDLDRKNKWSWSPSETTRKRVRWLSLMLVSI